MQKRRIDLTEQAQRPKVYILQNLSFKRTKPILRSLRKSLTSLELIKNKGPHGIQEEDPQ
jgi:hypothetical protein